MRFSLKCFLALVTVFLSAVTVAQSKRTPTYNLTVFDAPGASGLIGTQAYGINPQGDIVGVYVTNDVNTHGFLLRKGRFTAIDAPGASFPPPPTSGGTAATAINPQGDIVGYYSDSSDSIHGFLLSKGSFTMIDALGSNFTSPSGINPQGEIVGFFVDTTGDHGFLLNGGALTTIDVPGGTPGTTQALGINPRKDIVGYYGDSNDFMSNWLLSKGTFTAPITESLRPETCDCNGIPNAINPKGDIVGTYFDVSGIHGFLLSK